MTALHKFVFAMFICFLLAACGGQNGSVVEPVEIKEINASNVERVFATYLLEQNRTVDVPEQIASFFSLNVTGKDPLCPNGGTIKNYGGLAFEFDRCATPNGSIVSGKIDRSFLGHPITLILYYNNLIFRLDGDTLDQSMNGSFIASPYYFDGHYGPDTFSYSYLLNGTTTTYSRDPIYSVAVKIVTNEFTLELEDIDSKGKAVPHVVSAKDGSNIAITRFADGGVKLDLRNAAGAEIISTKQYNASEVAKLLTSERQSR